MFQARVLALSFDLAARSLISAAKQAAGVRPVVVKSWSPVRATRSAKAFPVIFPVQDNIGSVNVGFVSEL